MPPCAFRFAGREPRFIHAGAVLGDAAWKYLGSTPPAEW